MPLERVTREHFSSSMELSYHFDVANQIAVELLQLL